MQGVTHLLHGICVKLGVGVSASIGGEAGAMDHLRVPLEQVLLGQVLLGQVLLGQG